MVTRVPALDRGIEVLRLLATKTEQPLKAAAIGQALNLSPATCHAILTCLVDTGMVQRGQGKTYSIGPVLTALGIAAQSQQEGLSEARAEIDRLARVLGIPCAVSVAANDEMITVARARTVGAWVPTLARDRVPLIPPAGLVFFAWLDAAEFDSWLVRHGVTGSNEMAVYRQAASVVRERGYAGGLESSQGQLVEILNRLSDVDDGAGRLSVARDLVNILRNGVDFVAAPVFSPEGDVRLALAVLLPPESFVEDRFEEIAQELMAAASRVTAAIGGLALITDDRVVAGAVE